MSKKRKTRREKMRTLIRQSSQELSSAPVYSIETSNPLPVFKKDLPINTQSIQSHYAYVLHDARQTGIITSLILAANIILYIFIQNRILNLSVLGY